MTAPGTLLAGRYRLVDRIASGGMGSVWEAWDELLHRRVAVKQLLPQPGVSAEDAELARRRVIREARLTARLHHPNVVTLFDVVEHDGGPCLIMQFVPSRSLNALLKERGALPKATVVRLGAELSAGLAGAHEVGIVHRDVKPGNVLIGTDGSAKLTDFGISHAAGDANLTATGMVTGTPAFLAPEVARGGSSGFPADVFSFGATLYAALEGTPPFGSDPNPMAVLHRVASGQIIPPSRSGDLTPVLMQMLAIEPAERPSMAEVAQTLAARQAASSAPPDLLLGPTVALSPQTVREWPATQAAPAPTPEPGPWQGLVRDPLQRPLLPRAAAARLPLPATMAVPQSVSPESTGPFFFDDPDDPNDPNDAPRRDPAPPGGGRRWIWPVLAALIALLVVGGIILGLTSSRDDTDTAAGGATSSAASSTDASASSSLPEAAGLPTSAAPAPSPTESSAGPTESAVAPPEPSVSESTPTSTAPSPAPTSEAPPPVVSSAAPVTPDAPAGDPSADELAGFVTDYYDALPAGTDQGWEHLTARFQSEIAKNRGSYGQFWGGIDRVDITDVVASPPGAVEATLTYQFSDGRVAVERTAYSVVREGGVLKIDTSTVLSSQSP